jgi:hypothetical protein
MAMAIRTRAMGTIFSYTGGYCRPDGFFASLSDMSEIPSISRSRCGNQVTASCLVATQAGNHHLVQKVAQLAVDTHVLCVIPPRTPLLRPGYPQQGFTEKELRTHGIHEGNSALCTLFPKKLANTPPLLQDRLVVAGTPHVLDGQSKELPACVSHLLTFLFLLKGRIPWFAGYALQSHLLARVAHCTLYQGLRSWGKGRGLITLHPGGKVRGTETPVPTRRAKTWYAARIGPAAQGGWVDAQH